MLPVADIRPAVLMLPPVIFPVADTKPAVLMLPPTTLPPTLKLVNVPTVVRLEKITFELSVLPVNALALTALAVTPVN